jgi:rhamnulokinase
MVETLSCAAIDLGAGSGRVARVEWDGQRLGLREARRFDTPRGADPETGYQCWDLDAIEREILAGLAAAATSTRLDSVGVDGWGVDYVLLDSERRRVGPAVAYRDDRTRGVLERIVSRMPREEIYRRTGIQFLPFNTLYQLAATAERNPRWLERARHLLMLPDYFHWRLGGVIANEYTNATTTQLYGVVQDDWDEALLELASVTRSLLSSAVSPGTILGAAAIARTRAAKIITPATHDTASAVAALPLEPGDVFLISGTWSLMGIESERPLLGPAALRHNLTNEGGVERRFRVLKNIAGLWLTQRIASELSLPEAELVALAADAPAWRALIDPDDGRFLNPPSMIEALRGFCTETGQAPPADAGAVARCALESLALSYHVVKRQLERSTEQALRRVLVGGGGGKNDLLNQLTADACGVPVRVGPAESSLLGNGCVQLIGLGALDSLADARQAIKRSFETHEVEPRAGVPDEVRARFERLIERRPRFLETASTTAADSGVTT